MSSDLNHQANLHNTITKSQTHLTEIEGYVGTVPSNCLCFGRTTFNFKVDTHNRVCITLIKVNEAQKWTTIYRITGFTIAINPRRIMMIDATA